MTGLRTTIALLGAAGLLCGVAACASMPEIAAFGEPPIAADSPVAREVLEASNNPGPYPQFSDIPKKPTDVRSDEAWRASVALAEGDRAQIRAEAATVPATLTDTEGWAASTRAQAEAPPPANAVSTEEFLREMRAKAKPPIPPK